MQFVVSVVVAVCPLNLELLAVVDSMEETVQFLRPYYGWGCQHSMRSGLHPNHKQSPVAMVEVDPVVLECTAIYDFHF